MRKEFGIFWLKFKGDDSRIFDLFFELNFVWLFVFIRVVIKVLIFNIKNGYFYNNFCIV